MSSISIFEETTEANRPRFRALSGTRESVGRTAGEALDALNAELGDSEHASLIVVQQIGGDSFFSDAQFERLQDLLSRRDSLSQNELREMEMLAKAETLASAKRAEALADALGR
jgi:hypothetical protein